MLQECFSLSFDGFTFLKGIFQFAELMHGRSVFVGQKGLLGVIMGKNVVAGGGEHNTKNKGQIMSGYGWGKFAL